MAQDPFELFQRECPDLALRFDELVDAQRGLPGLDDKVKQLLNIAIQTAHRNPRGVKWHAVMAVQGGATRAEVIGAVAMNLHLSGLGPVLECLPAAVEGIDAVEGASG
jgi:alkylhydroperoxidase/carboxymuconolactone decarboxylase family protein YurZ